MTTLEERVEVLESVAADVIPRDELLGQLSATSRAAGEARDIAKRVEILLTEKYVPMVEEDHRTLRGKNGMPGLVSDVVTLSNWRRGINRLGWWVALALLSFLATLLYGLLSHRILLVEAARAVGG